MGGIDRDTTHDKYGGCELDFNSTPLSINIHPKYYEMIFQNTSMCSVSGDLAFYSNGCLVLNSLDEPMENGDSLNPGDGYEINCPIEGYVGFQNMFALPDSYNDSLYYLFYIDFRFDFEPEAPVFVIHDHLYCTIIDMSGDNGLGVVREKNKVIIKDSTMAGSAMTAVKHSNGLDWWILTPNLRSNSFNSALLDESGPREYEKQFIGIIPDSLSKAGQCKFSPDGSKFAWYHPRNSLYLYDFDRETGMLSNFQLIQIPDNKDGITGGCEFSTSGRFLYVNHDTSLFQLDIESEDIQSSLTHIADFDKFGDPFPTAFFYMERTPDHRIFMNVLNGSQWLHVIQEPNKKGAACRFEQHTIKLPRVNNFTIPHFPNFRLGPLGEPLCDSIWVSTEYPELKSKVKYKVAPNPTSGYLRVFPLNASDEVGYEVTIFGMNGKVWLTSKEREVDLSVLPAGVYICKISDGNGFVQIEKIVAVE